MQPPRHFHRFIPVLSRTGRRLVWLALVFALLSWCGESAPAQGLGDLIRALGNAINPRAQAEVIEIQMDGRGPQGPRPTDSQQQAYRDRLSIYLDAQQHWLNESLRPSPELAAKWKEISQEALQKELERFSKAPLEQSQSGRALGEEFPALFGLSGSSSGKVSAGMLQNVVVAQGNDGQGLSEEHRTGLRQANSERLDYRRRANRDYLIAVIDRDFYLTQAQREGLANAWAPDSTLLESPFVAWRVQNYYLPQESMQTRMTGKVTQLLNPAQQELMKEFTDQQSMYNYVTINMNGAREVWYKQIDDASRNRRDSILRQAAVQLAYLEGELKVPPEKLDRLKLAAKGAAVRITEEWKEQMVQTVEVNAPHWRGNGNISFSFGDDVSSGLRNNSLWTTTLRAMTGEQTAQAERPRQEWRRRATAGALVAMLDQELWLTSKQRDELLPLVEQSLPLTADPAAQQEYIREVVLLAHPLLKITEAQQKPILSAAQLAAWAKMKTYFAKPFGSNNVQIAVDGGTFSFTLMN